MKHYKIVKANKETQTKINHSAKELCFLLISAYTDLTNAVVASEEDKDIDLSDPSVVAWLEKIEKKAKKLKEKCQLLNQMKKYKVITLCGSTKFKDDFIRVQKELTLQGNIVISVGLFGHSGNPEALTEDTKLMLDDMHKHKIDMSDEIYVINKNGYIGESTKSEIEYAISKGVPVIYMEENKEEDEDE